MSMHMRTGRATLLAIVLVSLALSGCGPGVGSLSGKVRFKGKELRSGTVLLIGSDGIPLSAAISPDGAYEFSKVPVGDAKIGVSCPDPVVVQQKIDSWSKDRGRIKKDTKKPGPPPKPSVTTNTGWFPIPTRYEFPEKSGLTYTVTGRGNVHDIELTD